MGGTGFTGATGPDGGLGVEFCCVTWVGVRVVDEAFLLWCWRNGVVVGTLMLLSECCCCWSGVVVGRLFLSGC